MHSSNKVETLKQTLKQKKEGAEKEHLGEDEATELAADSDLSHQQPEETQADKNLTNEALKEAQKKYQETKDQYVRLYADFENYKKRTQKEKDELRRFAQEELLKECVPVLDDLERALAHSENGKESQNLIEGIKMVAKQMVVTFEKIGLQSLKTVGEPFNPHFHEAMAQQESKDYPPNTVLAEYRKGYTLNGKLIRPALVSVSK